MSHPSASSASGLKFFEVEPAAFSLNQLGTSILQELSSASTDMGHAWSMGCLASLSAQGPQQRLLMLREVNSSAQTLIFHTDRRSPKFSQIRNNPQVSALFYHSEARVQLVVSGSAKTHLDGALWTKHWSANPAARYRSYAGLKAPGTPSRVPSTNLPADAFEPTGQRELELSAKKNFALIEIQIQSLDILWLRRTGQYRATVTAFEKGWLSQWVEP